MGSGARTPNPKITAETAAACFTSFSVIVPSPRAITRTRALGVLIFSGLIAFDTQRLKTDYYALQGDQRSMAVATTMGALSLYLNFVNLFQFILSMMSGRDE